MSSHPSVTFEELTPAPPPETPAAAPVTTAAPAPPAETPQFTESDAEAYRTMVDAGITPTSYKDFLQKAQALDNLSAILRSNPRAFLNEIEKSDPRLAGTLKQEFSDAWYEQYQREHPEETTVQPGSTSRTTPSTDPRVDALQQKLDQLIADKNQEATAKQQETITEGYNKSLDSLVAKLPESTSEKDKDYIRLKAQELIWKDKSARERVAKGIYVDMPKHFAEATKLATAETKAAAEKEIDRREKVEARGEKAIPAAADPAGGTPSSPHEDPNWGPPTADEMAQLRAAYKK